MFLNFRRQVEDCLSDGLEDCGYHDPELSLEKPPDDVDAGLASATAFKLPGNPNENSDEILELLNPEKYELIGEVSTQGPYINFGYNDVYLGKTLESSQAPGYPDLPERDEEVVLEHTSANPTGPLHVGRARNPIIGDSLARILRKAGFDISVDYYVNDMGRQVATITWALHNIEEDELPEAKREKPDYDVVRYYRRANERLEGEEGEEVAEETESEIDGLLNSLEEGDRDALEKVEEAVDTCLEGQLESLERLGASYDNFVRESGFVLDGTVDELSKDLSDLEESYLEEDAYKLDLSEFGIGKELVYLRGDGTSLYTTRDIAYHIDKFDRCDEAVNVLGEDHKLQARQLSATLDLLGVDRSPENIFYSYVNLPEGKMSTRAGQVVNMDDLLDEAVERARREVEDRFEERDREIGDVNLVAEKVGLGAVRYDIVSRQAEKPITFDWEEALNFEGQHAPSIQYVYARASGILEKSEKEPDPEFLEVEEDEAVKVVEKVGELSDVVNESAIDREPHRLAGYSKELADLFNEFYRECRVHGSSNEEARLAVVNSVRKAVEASLDLIGVECPDTM
ncbi:MAG: arginine--tRNA ligase [Halobacteria archaeon]